MDKFQGLDTAGHPRRSKRPTRCNACHAYGAGAAPPDASGQQNSASQPVTNIEAQSAEHVVQLNMYHYVTFAVIMAGGLLFLAVILYFTGDVKFQTAIQKVVKRLLKTTALKQLATILSAMAFVKYGLEPVIKSVRRTTKAQGPWEKSSEYYILREVRRGIIYTIDQKHTPIRTVA